jgi:hypothetical protein
MKNKSAALSMLRGVKENRRAKVVDHSPSTYYLPFPCCRGMISLSFPPPQRQSYNPAQKASRRHMHALPHRTETRTSLNVTVDLSSLDIHTRAQEGVTENVSAHGARVVTRSSWRPKDHLQVRSLRGNLRSRARVVYCHPLTGGSFAIGLKLFARAGDWASPL